MPDCSKCTKSVYVDDEREWDDGAMCYQCLCAALEEQGREIERLRGLLKPFAEWCHCVPKSEQFPETESGIISRRVLKSSGEMLIVPTAADCRRAAEALK